MCVNAADEDGSGEELRLGRGEERLGDGVAAYTPASA